METDSLQLPFPDHSFNVVAISLALHHMPEEIQIQVMREMNRLARDRVIMVEWHSPAVLWVKTIKGLLIRMMDVSEYIQAWMHQDFHSTCQKAGLVIIREEILTLRFHRLTICQSPR